jgi:hypothetical protein
MPDQRTITLRIERELKAIHDPSLLDLIRKLLVEPYAVERDWDYGAPGQKYVCWTVLEHQASGTGVAYCEEGFGPDYPWGLVFLSGPAMNIGMDSAWFASLEDAVRESRAWDGENPADYEVS